MLKELEHQPSDADLDKAQRIADEAEGGTRNIQTGLSRWVIPVIAAAWSIFQLSISSFILMESTLVRAIHLAFAICLVFLSHPMFKKPKKNRYLNYFAKNDRFTVVDIIIALAATALALYIAIDYVGISGRQGIPIQRDLIIGFFLVLLLLEAARRALGPALPIVALVFILYSFFGPYMPSVLAFKGVSIQRFIGQITLSTEGIYGVPLDVSATIVFLFVLFGAMLDKAGAGKYFVDLAFSLLGRFKGGPAKAAVLASGLTGMVSGSSIANVVTTGTFTIPLMKSVGYPAHKAAAVEVACSTNGQLMPPIMGAAAFIIAEYCNLEYVEVIRAAFIPAVVSYIALMYITHLEASKLGLKGVPKADLPRFWKTFIEGIHFLIPLFFLIIELVVFRHSPALAAFRAILALTALIFIQNIYKAVKKKESVKGAIKHGFWQIGTSLVAGGKNMMGIGVAVASAGIIVGVVTLGLGGIITEVIEVLSGGNFFLILIITAIASLILGMGLPTTANYIVMASLTAPVILTLGAKNGIVIPLIAAHLFVFFFGILADDTPPVGLAAFAAAAIAKSDPIKTGIQGFTYDIRTAILPFMFIFNTELLLIGVDSVGYALWIFASATMAMFAFAALTQGYFFIKNKWFEGVALGLGALTLLRPELVGGWIGLSSAPKQVVMLLGIALIGFIYGEQRLRAKKVTA
ncbi:MULTISPECIES: TRAP transporter permease [unclassified Oceanispirochaeta]|uniref:TRAP transporter permease n=1 Tax=unclassified Oceanispirochaeta TaxID=2635722 RepID=UPI000E092DA7|nr:MULTISPECIES: TRAP transporter permease [unclassified Oceanispirochaeta]MBF9016432.1 TRAP transporter permease [Oceanispirochaeta sp. M2]NPD72894.1 TRAP transporter permease [Oceanispirochaeta sp. M1]RDG31471.1 TRAP transporter permease [Oceanispirochaeta sp. M1]